MKHLGQHFLKNQAAIKKIIDAIDLQPGETIVEIGPGHGELTLPLAAACKKVGVKIIAVEKDAELAEKLRTAAANLELENVITIFPEDALTFLKDEAAVKANIPPAYKLIGNIPYYITGHLLRTISELAEKPERCIFMIQKEVAERLSAMPPKMNRLAASVQYWAEPKTIMSLGKGDFSPQPEVDSAVIKLETRKSEWEIQTESSTERYYAMVRVLFAQPRKTILNNLADGKLLKKEIAVDLLQSVGVDPKARPQNLTIENILAIADACA